MGISQNTDILDTEAAATGITWGATTGITAAAGPNTFFVVYYDQYGGVWRTDAIVVDANNDVTSANVQRALRNLPNEVLEGVRASTRGSVANTCTRPVDGKQHIPSAEGHGTENICTSGSDITHGADATKEVNIDVEFADKPGQTGVQFLLEVNIAYQGDGAFPVSRGFQGTNAASSVYEKYVAPTTTGSKDTMSELAECSDRGLDNGDGECECFDGFRGLACEEQEALV